jgi:hypothetical protein
VITVLVQSANGNLFLCSVQLPIELTVIGTAASASFPFKRQHRTYAEHLVPSRPFVAGGGFNLGGPAGLRPAANQEERSLTSLTLSPHRELSATIQFTSLSSPYNLSVANFSSNSHTSVQRGPRRSDEVVVSWRIMAATKSGRHKKRIQSVKRLVESGICTLLQSRFAIAFLETRNKPLAAIRVGYSKKNAAQSGHQAYLAIAEKAPDVNESPNGSCLFLATSSSAISAAS